MLKRLILASGFAVLMMGTSASAQPIGVECRVTGHVDGLDAQFGDRFCAALVTRLSSGLGQPFAPAAGVRGRIRVSLDIRSATSATVTLEAPGTSGQPERLTLTSRGARLSPSSAAALVRPIGRLLDLI